MSIEERAEAYVSAIPGATKARMYELIKRDYIAGSTEQQALSEARIKELEETLSFVKQVIETNKIAGAILLLSPIYKALNNQQK